MRSRMAANESSAVGSVRTINTSEVTYAAQFPDTGYAATLDNLGGATAACTPPAIATVGAACLIDQNLTVAPYTKSGYTFTAKGGATAGTINNVYTVTGLPVQAGSTGNRGFYSDQSGVIRYSLDGTNPGVGGSPLQ